MKNHVHRSAARFAQLLLVGIIAVTGVLGVGSTADAVTLSTKQAQWNLYGLGYLNRSGIDGRTGRNTTRAARDFQTNRCLSMVDGAIGPQTSGELMRVVRQVQKVVDAPQDGKYGPTTEAKVKKWQEDHNLGADGQAGPNTFKKMGLTYKKRCKPKPPPKDPTNQRCAKGTRSVGFQTTYVRGKASRTRLCAIPGFKSNDPESVPGLKYHGKILYISGARGDVLVSYRVSGKVLKMFKDAKRAGITMSARSSFRTMEHQEIACANDARCARGDYGSTARPGYSNHQAGLALDINMWNTGYSPGATCRSGRSVGRNSVTWNWLHANAHKYGFRQYAAEAWHWEYAKPSADRC